MKKEGNSVHYVYLLVDCDHDRFKIGVSVDPVRRSYGLRQRFNFSMSFEAGFTRGKAYRVERMLHEIYRDMNVDVGECPGKTEWFDFACFMPAYNLLRGTASIVPVRRVKPKVSKREDWLQECLRLINQDGGAWIYSLSMRKLAREQILMAAA